MPAQGFGPAPHATHPPGAPTPSWAARLFQGGCGLAILAFGYWCITLILAVQPLRKEMRAGETARLLVEDAQRTLEPHGEGGAPGELAGALAAVDEALRRARDELAAAGRDRRRVLDGVDALRARISEGRRICRPGSPPAVVARWRDDVAAALGALATTLRAEGDALGRVLDAHWRSANALVVAALGLAAIALLLLLFVGRTRRRISSLEREASLDGLTGVLNRNAILRHAARELDRSRREGMALSLALVDVDDFKVVNDQLGHTAGDEALARVARRLTLSLRTYDAVGRYGGDEFLAVLPGCGMDQVGDVAERLQAAVREVVIGTTEDIRLSASLGIIVTDGDRRPLAELIDDADRALYRAKSMGKDCWQLAARPPPGSPAE